MQSTDQLFRDRFGILRTRDLLSIGLTRPDLAALLASGELERVRRGWYANPSLVSDDVRRAVTAGGVLTCVSALRARGIWTPRDARLHLRPAPRSTSQLGRTADSVVCRAYGDSPAAQHAVDELGPAVLSALRCVQPDEMVAVLDSILHGRRADEQDLVDVLADQPLTTRRLLSHTDGRSESGIESLVRYRLSRRRVSAVPQVRITGVGRVDLLIGRRLVIEVDGREFHTGTERFQSDRDRDRLLVRLGYLVIRLTYQDVTSRWDEVEPDILAVVRRDEHLIPPLHKGLPRGPRNRSAAAG